MEQKEYVKCFGTYIDEETPVLMLYEVDLEEERYATRHIDIFQDRHIEIFGEKEEFSTEAPVPTVDEINEMGNNGIGEDKFKAYIISKQEFEQVWNNYLDGYKGTIEFQKEI